MSRAAPQASGLHLVPGGLVRFAQPLQYLDQGLVVAFSGLPALEEDHGVVVVLHVDVVRPGAGGHHGIDFATFDQVKVEAFFQLFGFVFFFFPPLSSDTGSCAVGCAGKPNAIGLKNGLKMQVLKMYFTAIWRNSEN